MRWDLPGWFRSALLELAEIQLPVEPVGVALDILLHPDDQDLLVEGNTRNIVHRDVDDCLT